MDWVIVEKLSPSLAWPVVALIMFLIAVPVFYGRLGELIKAILALRDLPKTLQDTMKEQERLTEAFKDQITSANQEIDGVARKVQSLVGDLSSIRTELKTYQTEASRLRAPSVFRTLRLLKLVEIPRKCSKPPWGNGRISLAFLRLD
jgi:hypothetical protein